jgi:vacuolar-type H+-ATPase subunit H
MSQASLIPSLQSDALAREIERQLKNETSAVIAVAERDASAIITQARATARRRVHEAIQELRQEGARRLTRARAQFETEQRARAQRQAAEAVSNALPLLREELGARWRERQNRRQWTDAVARLCVLRLRPGAWLIEHPADWSEPEQRDFMATIGERDGVEIKCKLASDLKSGLRVKADQAVLDATPQGLLADDRTIAALILNEIWQD